MGDRDMRHAAGAEKAFLAGHGAVDELIDDHEIPRCHFLAERPAGGNAYHIRTAQSLKRVDIRAVGDRGRRMHMPPAMARQKDHGDPVQRSGQHLIRRRAPRSLNRDPIGILKPVDVVNAGAADHGDFRICHGGSLCLGWLPVRPKEPHRMPWGSSVFATRGDTSGDAGPAPLTRSAKVFLHCSKLCPRGGNTLFIVVNLL